jgi:hypothetical protein
MSMKNSSVSTDAVKSFLVKYRITQEEAKKSFLGSYEAGQLAKKPKPNEEEDNQELVSAHQPIPKIFNLKPQNL